MLKKTILITICFLANYAYSQSKVSYKLKADKQVADSTIGLDPNKYLQKTNTDNDDNRFEITSKNNKFRLSIGGRITLISMYDFGGMIDNNCFVTSLIAVPGSSGQQFGIYANMSKFNFKVEGLVKNRPLIAFLETDFMGAKNSVLRLRHAYFSYVGLTVGQTWSTFMDLDAAPKTVDGEGPNNEVAVRQPQIRYTYNLKKWLFSLAVEMPSSAILGTSLDGKIVSSGANIKLYEQKKHYPDIAAHVKYSAQFGHVQLAGVFRILNYGDSTSSANRTVYLPAGGVSLSGKFNIGEKTKILYQFNGGVGIANYMQDISGFKYDLVPSTLQGDDMRPSIMYGGYIAVSRQWHKNWQSNIMYGATKLQSPFNRDLTNYDYVARLYKYAQYAAVNTFWEFIPYGEVGLEYIWGQRANLNGEVGSANRINLLLRYAF